MPGTPGGSCVGVCVNKYNKINSLAQIQILIRTFIERTPPIFLQQAELPLENYTLQLLPYIHTFEICHLIV